MYYVHQSGFEGQWCKDHLEVVRWLCANFGLNFTANHQKLFRQLEEFDERGGALKNKDLGPYIEKYARVPRTHHE
jgi:hypothetical protein